MDDDKPKTFIEVKFEDNICQTIEEKIMSPQVPPNRPKISALRDMSDPNRIHFSVRIKDLR